MASLAKTNMIAASIQGGQSEMAMQLAEVGVVLRSYVLVDPTSAEWRFGAMYGRRDN
jgi:hypothetical protein